MDGWHPEDIKAAIRKTGITVEDLSVRYGLAKSTVRTVFLFGDCPAGEEAIIAYFKIHYPKVTPHDLWPDRYNENGVRIIGTPSKRKTTIRIPSDGVSVKKSVAGEHA